MPSLLNLLFMLLTVLAATASLKPLEKVLQQYQKAKSVYFEIEKTVEMPLLPDVPKKASGFMWLSKGRFRMELNNDEKTTIVMDGHTLWIAELFEGRWQVAKSSAPSLKKSNSLVVALFGDVNILQQMQLKTIVQAKDESQIYQLLPKKAAGLDVEKLEIAIHADRLTHLEYSDALGNRTQYEFKSVQLNKSIAAEKFKYQLPKNAEVSTF